MGSCHVAKAGIISSRKKALKITVQLSRWLAPIGCFVRHVCDEHCLRNDKHNRRLYRLRGRLPVTTYIESLFNNRELVSEESVKHFVAQGVPQLLLKEVKLPVSFLHSI